LLLPLSYFLSAMKKIQPVQSEKPFSLNGRTVARFQPKRPLSFAPL